MRGRLVIWLGMLPALVGLTGCGSKSSGELNVTEAKLSKIGKAYVDASYRFKRPPKNFQQIKDFLGPDASDDVMISPRDGEHFIIHWGIDYNRLASPSRENPFIVGGYEKTGVNGTRYVLRFPLGVIPMTEEEFRKANFPSPYKAP